MEQAAGIQQVPQALSLPKGKKKCVGCSAALSGTCHDVERCTAGHENIQNSNFDLQISIGLSCVVTSNHQARKNRHHLSEPSTTESSPQSSEFPQISP